MNLEMITEGLKQLLQENNYTPATIRFYEREWNKIQCFLTEEYGNTEYDMERGLKYLENRYGFITKYNDGILSQQRVQLLRVVHMLEDYRLHQVLTRRYYASKGITHKRIRYDAHIYTDEELQNFFDAVDKSQSVPDSCPYRADVMPVFFRILYTSGMRVSELRLARIRDINLEEGYITVHEAKNHKERLIPIHPSLTAKCKELKEKIHSTSSEDEYFFMMKPGQPMTLVNVYRNFRRYLENAGISHTGRGPRVHDFRHTYCVNLLRKWTDEGKDLIAYLPYMRTMLGHEGFEETAYYLKLTAERFPYIKERMKESFPDLIKEAQINEHEFY